MPMQLAAPGVKHGDDPELGAEPVWVAPQLEQGAGGCLKQQVVDELGMATSEATKLGGQGKGDVEAVRIEQAVQAPIEPALSSQSLALGAMAVTARIVDRTLEATVAAHLQVAPRAAVRQRVMSLSTRCCSGVKGWLRRS